MPITRNKFNNVNQRAKLEKEQPASCSKPRSPIGQFKVIGRCGESIKQLEKIRAEKVELTRAIPGRTTLNVWERLSRAKRSLNENGQVLGNPYRHELCIRARQETHTFKPQTTFRIPRKKSPPVFVGIKKEPPVAEPFVRKTSNYGTGDGVMVYKSMTDLMLPREMCDSSTSMEEITPKNSSKSLESIYTDQSNDWVNVNPCFIESDDKFISATSMIQGVRSQDSISARIAHDFRTALEKRCCFMTADEINVVKNLIKTDKRLKKGKHSNEDVLCEILRAKLRKISREEHILRTALQNLGNLSQKPISNPKILTKICNKPQVHVILRNIPNAQREVVILRALGQRLEKTLNDYPHAAEVSKRSACTITPDIHVVRQIHFILGPLHYAVGRVRVQAVCMHIAFVREFSIANKSINDLKNEKRHFYLPANEKHTELRRTSFKRLRENPKLFMSFLQCKNSLVPFNVLEQDSMFLNRIFYDPNRDSTPSEYLSEEEETVVISEPNDPRRYFMRKEALKIEEIPSTSYIKTSKTNQMQEANIGDMPSHYALKSVLFEDETTTETESLKTKLPDCLTLLSTENTAKLVKPDVPLITDQAPTLPNVRRKRRIRKTVSPLPERKYVSPKNKLLIFIIVGMIELSLFLTLIISYIYPEIICINNLKHMINKNR